MNDLAVGLRVPRIDARDKLTGRAQFSDDLKRPGMLFAALAVSPHAHARIVSYDVSQANALAGVKAVITGADFPARRVGAFVKDETMFAKDRVRYVGEPVAAVAATDPRIARKAADLIEVVYEDLPAVLDIDAALAPGAPTLHEGLADYVKVIPGEHSTGNVIWASELGDGDVDGAWAQCDVIVEGVYETPAQYHACMEPWSGLAEVDANGRVSIWSCNQSVHYVQQRVSDELGLPMAKIRVLTPRIGGGFGGRHATNGQSILAALALATGRAVKLTLTRAEDFEINRSRHAARIRAKTGAKKDGTLVAREFEVLLDGGAYADESPSVLSLCVLIARGPYRVPHVRCRGRVVYTNKLRAGAFRGFGGPQMTFAGESQIDELARKLGIDPMELRLKNAMRAGDKWTGGQTVASCGLVPCLERVRDEAKSWMRTAPPPAPGRRRGIGYSAFTMLCGMMGVSAAVHLRGDGSVALSTGIVDIGQGSDTALSQICAETLRIPVDNVTFASPDTDSAPYNWKTAGSRITYMGGRAVHGAAIKVSEKILQHASELMECSVADLELRPGGKVGLVGVPGREIGFKEIAQRAQNRAGGPIIGSHEMVYEGERLDPKRALTRGFIMEKFGVYVFGAQALVVEVDEVTGKLEVMRAWSAHDVGKAINPTLAEGQIQGGFVQALGYALTEELVWDRENGRLTNPSLVDYKIPGALDVPVEITPILIEDPEPTGPFGAKGVGEPCVTGVAPAIANALENATGIRMRKIPMTPERVLDALLG